ncbi:MAG UNVERIFIED_CONTAM: hypothetical protein LVT10_05215 [Anaerolineae bacterium]
MGVIRTLADRVMVMRNGEVIEAGLNRPNSGRPPSGIHPTTGSCQTLGQRR